MEFYSKTSYEKIRQPEGILKNWFWKYEQSGENYRVKRYIPWGNEASLGGSKLLSLDRQTDRPWEV